jgi:hypothetical protein
MARKLWHWYENSKNEMSPLQVAGCEEKQEWKCRAGPSPGSINGKEHRANPYRLRKVFTVSGHSYNRKAAFLESPFWPGKS